MTRAITARLGQALLASFGVLTLVFFIMRLSGDPTLLLVPEGATAEQVAQLRHLLGFDRPWGVQYLAYLGQLAHLDLGESLVQRAPVLGIVAQRIPYTVALASGALLVAIGIGVPAGIAMAVWRGSLVERALAGLVLAGQSLPTFWSGILLILLFGVTLGWLPTSGSDGPESLRRPTPGAGRVGPSVRPVADAAGPSRVPAARHGPEQGRPGRGPRPVPPPPRDLDAAVGHVAGAAAVVVPQRPVGAGRHFPVRRDRRCLPLRHRRLTIHLSHFGA